MRKPNWHQRLKIKLKDYNKYPLKYSLARVNTVINFLLDRKIYLLRSNFSLGAQFALHLGIKLLINGTFLAFKRYFIFKKVKKLSNSIEIGEKKLEIFYGGVAAEVYYLTDTTGVYEILDHTLPF